MHLWQFQMHTTILMEGPVDENPFPDQDDPSAFTGPNFGDLPDDHYEANAGAFEGGITGTTTDPAENNSNCRE